MLLCTLFNSSLLCADELSLDKAIQIVKNAERQVSALEWSANITHTFSPPKSSQAQRSIGVVSVLGLYDFSSKRYRIEFKEIVRESTEKMIDASYSIGLSYDGKTYCSWQGTKIEKDTYRSSGILTNNLNEAWHHDMYIQKNRLRILGLVTGLPGAIYSYITDEQGDDGVRLSDTLVQWAKNKVKVSVSIEDTKSYIHFLTEEPAAIENTILRTSIIFDIKRGAISEVELSRVKANDVIPFCKWEVEFGEGENVSLPNRTVYQDYANYSKYVFEYKTLVVNPKRTPNDYLCEMPKGTTVKDNIKKLIYKVGAPVDEDKAIEKFMTIHGLTGNVPPKLTSGGIVRYILIGTGCLLILIALILKFCKRKQS